MAHDDSGDVRPPSRRLSLADVAEAFNLGGIQLDTDAGQQAFGRFLRQGFDNQEKRLRWRGTRAKVMAGIGGAILTGLGAIAVEAFKQWLKLSP